MLKINDIYNYDAIDFLKMIDDESVDLAVVDPPYGIKVDKWDVFKDHEDFLLFTRNWIDELIPKLKKNGSLYIFNTPFNSAYILQYLIEKNLFFQNWIVWDKRDGLAANKFRYNTGQETILFFTKSKNGYTFNYDDIRIPYESTDRMKHAKTKGILSKNGTRWFPNENGKLCNDVWHITSQRHKEKCNGKVTLLEHKTVKPYDMIERIITASSNINDLVIDPFVGRGTTAIISNKLNRNFICNDIDSNYVDIGKILLL